MTCENCYELMEVMRQHIERILGIVRKFVDEEAQKQQLLAHKDQTQGKATGEIEEQWSIIRKNKKMHKKKKIWSNLMIQRLVLVFQDYFISKKTFLDFKDNKKTYENE